MYSVIIFHLFTFIHILCVVTVIFQSDFQPGSEYEDSQEMKNIPLKQRLVLWTLEFQHSLIC